VVWNEVLFCDLLRQSTSMGILTDYDASAAFDRVLHTITIITCRRLGLPLSACMFLYNLLHQMEFHLITGLVASNKSFSNNADSNFPCQGMLQASSSAAPVYNINSDVNLSTYCCLAHGATFTHPITNKTHTNHAKQYVDDMSALLNIIQDNSNLHESSTHIKELFHKAKKNTNTWSKLLWISGGALNASKCFYYFINPKYDHKSQKIQYGKHTSDEHITFKVTVLARYTTWKDYFLPKPVVHLESYLLCHKYKHANAI
jgi:hypothetical protein